VMTPGSPCYFDHYQGSVDQEPLAIGGYNPLSKVYTFNPVPNVLDAGAAKHILGGQANLWTEYVPNFRHAEYMIFPRIAALAEALWTPKDRQSWDDFSRRILMLMNRYDMMGINYAKSAFQVMDKTQFDPDKKQLAVSLSSELTGAGIHFTTDGSDPTNLSPVYTTPVLLDTTSTLKAISFESNNMSGKVFTQTFNINKATFKPVKYLVPYSESYKGSGDYTLVNGVRGSTNHSDGEWQAWEGTNMEVVIDLQQPTTIHQISVGSIQNSGSWIFFPRKVEFYVSSDGANFQKVAEAENEVDPLSGNVQLKDFYGKFEPVTTNYVKVVARNLRTCPPGHAGAGQAAWLFVDEISAE